MMLLNKSSRSSVAVIGAGPAGLGAALRLQDAGHAVTVFEAGSGPGGKVQTVDFGSGVKAELGAVTLNRTYEGTLGLAERFGVGVSRYPNKLAIYRDGDLVDYLKLWRESLGVFGMLSGAARLAAVNYHHAGVIGGDLASAAPDLTSKSATQFFREQGLGVPLDLLNLLSVGSGYAHFDSIPAVYAVRGLNVLGRMILEDGVRAMTTDRLPGMGLQAIDGGFQTLWNRVAQELDVRYDHPVARVRRTVEAQNGITISTDASGDKKFDRIIVATPPWATLRFLDATSDETEALSRIQKLQYRTYVVRANGLPKNVTAFYEDNIRTKRPDGLVSLIHAGADVYTAYQFLDGVDETKARAALAADLVLLGARNLVVEMEKTWDYFPHVPLADLRRHPEHFRQMQELQGNHGTFFAGSGEDLETVETALSSGYRAAEAVLSGTG